MTIQQFLHQKKDHPQTERTAFEQIQMYEPKANLITANILIISAIASLFIWVCFQLHLVESNMILAHISLLGGAVLLFLPAAVTIKRQGKGTNLRFLMFAALICYIFAVNLMSGFKLQLLLAIPLFLSISYSSKRLIRGITGYSMVFSFFSVWCNAYLYDYTKILDPNTAYLTTKTLHIQNGDLFTALLNTHPDSFHVFLNGVRMTLLPDIIIFMLLYLSSTFILDWNLNSITTLQEVTEKEAAQQVALADMRTRIMLSQLQPHFLYNALTAIAFLCDENPTLAQDTTINFSQYLRANMDSLSSKEPITAKKELEHIRAYLEIEKLRFPEKVHIDYDIQDINFKIPALTLQYLVHNAVEHGLCKTRFGGTVRISIKKIENAHKIMIEDDGAGFDVSQFDWEDTTHLGLRTVRSMLSDMVNGSFTIESQIGEGTTATILIPLQTSPKKQNTSEDPLRSA